MWLNRHELQDQEALLAAALEIPVMRNVLLFNPEGNVGQCNAVRANQLGLEARCASALISDRWMVA